MTITVIKRDGSKQKFSKTKLEHGIKKAAEKTSVDAKIAAKAANEIRIKIEKAARKKKDKTIKAIDIRTILLKELDKKKTTKEIANSFRSYKDR